MYQKSRKNRGSIVSKEEPEEISEEEIIEPAAPIEVKLIKEKEEKEPDFDHDNYLPSEEEILETEKEIHENIKKRYVTNA